MFGTDQLLGTSAAVRTLSSDVEHAASSDAKVLISGESGAGKEIAARLIHAKSSRAARRFVSINCPGIPDTLLESELFGHVRGSFTGAFRDRPGLFEVGNGGTVFLDEVGDMSLRMQALLLRFLETGEIQRVGEDRIGPRVDVRVVAATNRVLQNRIEEGEFRSDLYYRLNVIHVLVPPLRERREDIPVLLDSFLRWYTEKYRIDSPEISAEARELLMEYDWPGNVRELRNVVERFIVRRQRVVRPCDLAPELRRRSGAAARAETLANDARPLFNMGGMIQRMLNKSGTFWNVVHQPFMSHELTVHDIRALVVQGLEQSEGSYSGLADLFNIKESDQNAFIGFLKRYKCHVPPSRLRTGRPSRDTQPASAARG